MGEAGLTKHLKDNIGNSFKRDEIMRQTQYLELPPLDEAEVLNLFKLPWNATSVE